MLSSVAQMVALTCYGNVLLHGGQGVGFFPGNSTCEGCESITFLVSGTPPGGETQWAVFADTPDTWMRDLSKRGALGFRLHQRAQNTPGISDRDASAFANSGRQWMVEVVRKGQASEFWRGNWEVGNKYAPEHKIWKVSYWLWHAAPTPDFALRPLGAIVDDLRAALKEIRAFAEAHECGNFTPSFDGALRALDEPDADIGYHKDLYPPGGLSEEAKAALKAAQSAWVFGGMGSWNDMWFEGEAQAEYERVSDRLFELLNDAVEAAATSSFDAKAS